MPTPVIFLGGADPTKHLRLTEEFNAVQHSLDHAVTTGLCELVIEYNLNTRTLFQQFNRSRFTDSIAIFHYSGHAREYGLLLDNMAVDGRSLNAFLREYSSIRLVFLNGCATMSQAEELASDGLAVIASTNLIKDGVAIQFADMFYRALSNDNDLYTAFKRAESALSLQSKTTDGRSYMLCATDDQKRWKLSDETNNPYFGLPLPLRGFLPPDPYISIRPYTESEWPVFWGRGTNIRDLYLNILDKNRNPVVLLYGQLGVGKSSLLDAGLVPRLRMRTTVFYARRVPDKGLSATFFSLLNKPGADAVTAANHLLSLQNAPIVLIIDQVEEVFTKPVHASELTDFLQVLRHLLAARRLSIKIILGYRKEYHAEVEAAVSQTTIPFTTYFLQPLNIDNLKEIITGSQSTEALRQHYRIKLEPDLQNTIATELSGDPDSPVAPILQILMTKMWQQVKGNDPRRFTLEFYYRLREQGIALTDFITEKIDAIAKEYPQEVESGLLLDLLYFHTTSLSTAATHAVDDIVARYGKKDVIIGLVERCKAQYLLTDTKVAGQVSLAHDLLAPIIRALSDNSLLPGQKANRLLVNQEPYLKNVDELQPLNERDLATAKAGKDGMRVWNEAERELVRISEREHVRRNVRRIISVSLSIAAIVTIIGAGIALFFAARRTKLESERSLGLYFNAEARNVMNENPALALHLLRSADSLYPENNNILTSIYSLYNQRKQARICYRDFYSAFATPGIEVSPDERSIILFNADIDKSKNKQATIADINGLPLGIITYKNAGIVKTKFFAKSKRIMTLLENWTPASNTLESYIIITDLSGKVLSSQSFPYSVYDFFINEKDNTYITFELQKPSNVTMFGHVTTVNVRSIASNEVSFSHTCDFPKLDAYDISKDKNFFAYVNYDSLVIVNMKTGVTKQQKSPYRTKLHISPNTYWILTYGTYNGATLYDIDGNIKDTLDGSLESARFSPSIFPIVYVRSISGKICARYSDGSKHCISESRSMKDAFVASESGMVIGVPNMGQGLAIYEAGNNSSFEVNTTIGTVYAFNDNNLFATTSENHVRLWSFNNTTDRFSTSKFFPINSIRLTTDELYISVNGEIIGSSDNPIRMAPYHEGLVMITDTFAGNSSGRPAYTSSIYYVDSLHGKTLVKTAPYYVKDVFVNTSAKRDIGLVCGDGAIRVIDSSGNYKWQGNDTKKHRRKRDDINAAAFSLTGDTIFAVTDNGRVLLFNDKGDSINQLSNAIIDSSQAIAITGAAQMAACPRSLKIAVLLHHKRLVIYDLHAGTRRSVELKTDARYSLRPGSIIDNGKYVLIEASEMLQILDAKTLLPINVFKHHIERGYFIAGDTAFLYDGLFTELSSYPLPINVRKWIHTVDIGPLPEDYRNQYYSGGKSIKASN